MFRLTLALRELLLDADGRATSSKGQVLRFVVRVLYRFTSPSLLFRGLVAGRNGLAMLGCLGACLKDYRGT